MKRFVLLAIMLAATLVGASVLPPTQAKAASAGDFNASRIIDDHIFFNPNTMNPGDIQNFLNAKVPTCDTNGSQPSGRAGYPTRADWGRANGAAPPYVCLRHYVQAIPSMAADSYCNGIGGGTKTAADIIFNVAQACGINPQVLLVTLQKEQALVTDDWPWPKQYRTAMGYGCPDTAPCDAQYYGFFNQLYNAARRFKNYVRNPQQYNHAIGRNSFIGYNPNAACGGSHLTPQTQATAALYNYTPYQPNAAALGNLYGTGDGCSAYGNRNFWRMFTDWFGPTLGGGYVLALNTDDNTQWVIHSNLKQKVPSPEIIRAWGLPSSPVAMSSSYLATIPSGPELGRLMHAVNSPYLYFVDGGKRYLVTSPTQRDVWGFTGQVESYVSTGLWLLPQDGGYLQHAVKKASSPSLYMVDGKSGGHMTLRQYSDPNVFHTWEGEGDSFTTVSDEYFDQIDNAIGDPLTGYTAKSASDANQYQVVSGQKLYLSATMASIFNQSYETVNQLTINRLVTSAPASNFVRLPGNGVPIYLVDQGTRHPVSSIPVLLAWTPGNVPPQVNVVNQAYLNLLTSGGALNTHLTDVGGQLYVMDGQRIPVPSNLDSAYRASNVFSASSALVNHFPGGANATGFIRGSGPSIYLMDQGTIKHITSAESMQLWNGTRNEAVTHVNEAVLWNFSHGGQIGHYFSSGGTNYVIDNGSYRSVAAGVAADWGLSNPASVSASTRDRFTAGSALSQKVKVGGTYFRVKHGQSNATTNSNLAVVWGLTTSPVDISSNLIGRVAAGPALSPFARSTDANDQRIFLADAGGSYYHIDSIQQFQNFGASSPVPVSPADLGTPGAAKNILKTSTANTERVIDSGQKRSFVDNTIKSRWVTGSNALTVSSNLWDYFNDGPALNGNIKASAPNVYNIDGGQKRWIQSQGTFQAYTTQYGSYSNISDLLAHLLPAGSDLP